ncbi:MAG: hypothetical protein U1E02_25770, partial [Hydrogenophaga sp.]|nr:hypothetical protein [Hydrogenophaga sp.]
MSKPHPDFATTAAAGIHQGDSSEMAPSRSGFDPGLVTRTAAWTGSAPTVWTTEARDALSVDFRATLQRGVHG